MHDSWYRTIIGTTILKLRDLVLPIKVKGKVLYLENNKMWNVDKSLNLNSQLYNHYCMFVLDVDKKKDYHKQLHVDSLSC